MKNLLPILGTFTVLAAIVISGFGCVANAGEALHNVDGPPLLRTVQFATGALLLVLCIAMTYLFLGAATIATRGESE